MFQNFGKERLFSHDLKLASILSLAAGSVNSASFFAFDVLTTNITGHVAVLANEIVAYNWYPAQMKLLWMGLFFLGAFISSIMVEVIGSRYPRFSHTLPLIVEMAIISFVGYYGHKNYDYSGEQIQLLAGSLLFAMGLQNAMVTIVSGSVIRTTHLTGLFTDLGIESAKLLLKSSTENRNKLWKKYILHLSIVICFFLGAIIGGFLYAYYLFQAFIAPLFLLFIALLYDLTYARLYMVHPKIQPTTEKLAKQSATNS